jgi:general secretion pathway protein E
VSSVAVATLDPGLVRAARVEAFARDQAWLPMLQQRAGLDAAEFVRALAALACVEPIASVDLFAATPDFARLSYGECVRRDCVLLRDEAGGLRLVLTDPFAEDLAEWAARALTEAYALRLAHLDDVRGFLAKAEQAVHATDRNVEGVAGEGEGADAVLSLESIEGDTSPVVRLVSSILYDALKQQASDIHLKSTPTGMSVKFRIDGVLVPVSEVAGVDTAQRVVSRIKVMSALDIAERRVPQDGRFRVAAVGGSVDFRVSIMPSIHGEDAVLRLLDRSALTGGRDHLLGFDDLAMDPQAVAALRKLVAQPYGMVLVTGPTGSGKTTTLYAAIDEINSGQENIVTIEDPVEYQLAGVLQIPVNEKKGLTFARGLRSILRHDPDKIMVGEIRDEETAQIAIQSALTGHLVFTTVHANNVVDVLGRFLNMKVDLYNFVSALNCVLAQRLVRRICDHCKREVKHSDGFLIDSGLDPADYRDRTFYEGAGCLECNGTGFHGRSAISELLDLSDRIRGMILDRRPASEIKKVAKDEGMTFLRESALLKVMDGQTTLREINKVTFVE